MHGLPDFFSNPLFPSLPSSWLAGITTSRFSPVIVLWSQQQGAYR